jgi:ABC-type branched-subunit amino acid transport system substrate-binding protein
MAARWRRAGAFLVAAAVGLVGPTGAAGSGRKARSAGSTPVHARWETFGVAEGLPDASIRSIHVAGEDVWVGTDAGPALGRDGRWRVWTGADGLPRAPITAIDTDARTGDVWLGSLGAGLIRFTAGRFDRFTQFNSGLAGDQVFGVAVAGGRVWAATNGGVSRFEPATGSWDLYVEPHANVPETVVTGFGRDGDGLVAGTWCGPLLRFDPVGDAWGPITPGRTDMAGGGAPVRLDTSVAAAAAGRSLWWVTQDGLFRRVREGRWRAIPIPHGDEGGTFVTCLGARSAREAWVGTDAGLLVLPDWSKGSWVAYRRIEETSRGSVTLTRSGTVVGSRVVASTLPDNRVRCLAFQGGHVWVGTRAGLARGTGPVPWREVQAAGGASVPPGVSPSERAGTDGPPTPVSIGVLNPLARPIARPGASAALPVQAVDRSAVARAVRRANARRRSLGRPDITLVEKLYTFARYSWGTPQDTFSILRDAHDVRGFVGYVAPHARIDTAMALRTEVPVVNVAATDPTIDESVNPWIFRCGSNDPRRHRLLLDFVLDALGRSRLALVRAPDPDSRVHVDRWASHARARGYEPVAELELDPETADLSPLLEALRRSGADVVLTWADARTSADLLRGMRAAGLGQLFVGADRIVSREFVDLAGGHPGEVIAFARCPHFEVADDTAPPERDDVPGLPPRTRSRLSPHAGRSLEASAHLLAAIELAGAEPEAIAASLREMRAVRLATLEQGTWRYSPLSAP